MSPIIRDHLWATGATVAACALLWRAAPRAVLWFAFGIGAGLLLAVPFYAWRWQEVSYRRGFLDGWLARRAGRPVPADYVDDVAPPSGARFD